MPKYRFTATLLFSCEAENEDDAWEQFQERLGYFPVEIDDFNDIEIEDVL